MKKLLSSIVLCSIIASSLVLTGCNGKKSSSKAPAAAPAAVKEFKFDGTYTCSEPKDSTEKVTTIITVDTKKNQVELERPLVLNSDLKNVTMTIDKLYDYGLIATYESEKEVNDTMVIYLTSYDANETFNLEIDYADGAVEDVVCKK